MKWYHTHRFENLFFFFWPRSDSAPLMPFSPNFRGGNDSALTLRGRNACNGMRCQPEPVACGSQPSGDTVFRRTPSRFTYVNNATAVDSGRLTHAHMYDRSPQDSPPYDETCFIVDNFQIFQGSSRRGFTGSPHRTVTFFTTRNRTVKKNNFSHHDTTTKTKKNAPHRAIPMYRKYPKLTLRRLQQSGVVLFFGPHGKPAVCSRMHYCILLHHPEMPMRPEAVKFPLISCTMPRASPSASPL